MSLIRKLWLRIVPPITSHPFLPGRKTDGSLSGRCAYPGYPQVEPCYRTARRHTKADRFA
jgi:hypothetical protein